MHRRMHYRAGWRAGSFTATVAVGLTVVGLLGASLAGLAGMAERNRRRGAARSQPEPPLVYPPADPAGLREQRERRELELDSELAQTFPASDPLPHFHQVD